ncbi:MAG: hypothetical protein U1G07_12475 [Verrucomicrobiota bacterium]
MKTPHVPNDDDVLLDAILTDETWQAWEGSVRRDALASLRAQKVRRRVQRWAAGAGALAAMAAFGAVLFGDRQWLGSPATSIKEHAVAPVGGVLIRDFKEGELVALFPKGSCLMAEVDGRPTFIILNEERALQGFEAR